MGLKLFVAFCSARVPRVGAWRTLVGCAVAGLLIAEANGLLEPVFMGAIESVV